MGFIELPGVHPSRIQAAKIPDKQRIAILENLGMVPGGKRIEDDDVVVIQSAKGLA